MASPVTSTNCTTPANYKFLELLDHGFTQRVNILAQGIKINVIKLSDDT